MEEMGAFLRNLSCSTLFWLKRIHRTPYFAERIQYLCKDRILFDHIGNSGDNMAIRFSGKNSGAAFHDSRGPVWRLVPTLLNYFERTEATVQSQVGNITSIYWKYFIYSNLTSAQPGGRVGRSFCWVGPVHKEWVGLVNCVAWRTRFLLWSWITSICAKSVTQNTSFIILFSATCVGYNCESSSGLFKLCNRKSYTLYSRSQQPTARGTIFNGTSSEFKYSNYELKKWIFK
jgi:hypothetical protein